MPTTEHLEKAELVRVDADNDKDPYTKTLVLDWVSEDTVEVKGMTVQLLPSEWRAVEELMAAKGIRQYMFRRYRDGKFEVTVRKINHGNGRDR